MIKCQNPQTFQYLNRQNPQTFYIVKQHNPQTLNVKMFWVYTHQSADEYPRGFDRL